MSNLARLHTLFFFALSLLLIGRVSANANSLYSAEGRGLHTNAKRMQAGLPPLKPRNLYGATRVVRSQPSGQPVKETCGASIKLVQGSQVIGYVSNTLTNGAYKVDRSGNANNHLKIKFTPSSTTAFNIAVENAPRGAKPNLGFGSTNDNLNVANSYNVLTGTTSLPIGSPPVSSANSLASTYGRSYAESAVWVLTSSTSSLTAKWVNPGGKVTVTTDFYITQNDEIVQVATGISGPAKSTKVSLFVVE